MYRLLRPLLFHFDPEAVHELTLRGLAALSHRPALLRALTRHLALPSSRLRVRCLDLDFPNPVGLAAGLDKNGVALPAWASLGFGSVELGSVTAEGQPGNPRPRLYRLPEQRALINRMGFNNDGATAVASRLASLRRAGLWPEIPVGVNIGKTMRVATEEAAGDYRAALEQLWPHADYLVVNVSSPNTPGLTELQSAEYLGPLLQAVTGLRTALGAKPLLLKIAPDLEPGQVEELAAGAEAHGFDGFVATNTTRSRPGVASSEPGGLSGRPLARASLRILKQLVAASDLPIISVGGVDSAADLFERLAAGASLVQVYTGLIYHGPGWVRNLNRELLSILDARGIEDLEALRPPRP